VAGSYLGGWIPTQIHADNLKRACGGFIILVGVKSLLGKYSGARC